MNPIQHVAIIMDGNGRWGKKHKNSRNAGHRAGLNTVEKIINSSIQNNIKYFQTITFWGSRTATWHPPKITKSNMAIAENT